MQKLDYNGYQFAYSCYGDADAPAIVLIMGLGMAGVAWPPSLISYLVREGFYVVVPDNRDCGESARFTEFSADGRDVAKAVALTLCRRRVTSGYALEDMAFDVERLLDHLGIRRAHVTGISMGGMIAQVMATQCPNRVASLISIASASGNPDTGLGNWKAIWTLLRKPADIQTEAGLRNYFAKVFRVLSGPVYQPDEAEMNSMLNRLPSLHYDAEAMYRQLLAILASGDRSAQLARVLTPTLVIHGTADPLLPFTAGEEVARVMPKAELVPITGMGHQLPEKLMPQIGALIAGHCHRHPA